MMNWIKKFLGKEEVLWAQQDQMYPPYSVQVIRVKPYIGELRVKFHNRVVFKSNVAISYDAKFGVDYYDLEAWSIIAVAASDKHMADLNARTED